MSSSTASPFAKFEHRAPSPQNAVDIFEGKWACDLGDVCPGLRAGPGLFFTTDNRPRLLADLLGTNGRLDEMTVLELGPLEGHHTYQLERLGAKHILAIESNVEAFLKCLIIKEIFSLRVANFMLGDCVEYLNTTSDTYDIVMCSGLLYHMSDPIGVIRQIARVTGKCFVWTHYYDQNHCPGPAREIRTYPQYPNVKMHVLTYDNMADGRFWGGNKPTSAWLYRDDILTAFREAGFTSLQVIEDTPDHPNGACFSFAASRNP
jgi:hypothetical protein